MAETKKPAAKKATKKVEAKAEETKVEEVKPAKVAKKEAKKVVITGDALKKFYEFVKAQGGRLGELAISEKVIKVRAQKTGRIDTIDALGAAKLAAKLGASRVTLEDKIDYSVGIMLSVTEGDTVNKGDLLMNLYVKDYNQQFTESDFDFIQIVDL